MREHHSTVTSKGQVTVPIVIRKALGIEHGDANVTVVLDVDRQPFIDRWTEMLPRP